ncbi:MAG: radical SAM protein [Clostridium sp.]|nr:radical SAM protein [Clostridium sp.]
MRIGLIDVDSHNFPNIPLMKLSAWHKSKGDSVEWYEPLLSGHMDKVYVSKVFSFTQDYEYYIDADEIVRRGSGYCISNIDGREVYDKGKDMELQYEIEHIYPDYTLYPELTKDTAYGFLTRGCPRGCSFCHVQTKEGNCSYKVADLREFWKGQKNIVLCDPNLIACKDWEELLQQLIDSKAYVNINQGFDIRIMTEEKAELIKKLKIKSVHFAWDRYKDKDYIIPKLKMFKSITGWDKRKMTVFVLTNYDTSMEQDLERIYKVRELGYNPYVMIYKKYSLPRGHELLRMQRWVNSRIAFEAVKKFEDYRA